VSRAAQKCVALCVVVSAVLSVTLPADAEPTASGPHYLASNVGGNVPNASPYGLVVCVGVGDCTTVGPLHASGFGRATALTETAGVWSAAVGITLPTNADPLSSGGYSDLNSVACWSAGNCVATGAYAVAINISGDYAPIPQPMVVDETAGVWGTAQELDLPASTDVEGGEMYAVSCDDIGDCTVVGYYIAIDPSTEAVTPFAITSTQLTDTTTWAAISDLPIPNTAPYLVIPWAVSCSEASTCVAIEGAVSSVTNGREADYFVDENSGTWSPPTAVPTAGKNRFEFDALSCPEVGDCVATGFGSTSAANLVTDTPAWPAVDTETNGTWATPQVLSLPFLSPATNEGTLPSVSCYSTTLCVAVGAALESPTDQTEIPLIAADVNGTWTSSLDEAHFIVGTKPAALAELTSVVCTSATNCLVVGAAATGTITVNGPVSAFWSTISPTELVSLPGKPSDVMITPGGVVTKVTFEPPSSDGGSKLTLFTVTAKASKEATRTCTTPGLSCTFKGAVKGKTYTVTVTAHNAHGQSLASPPRTFVAK
jgi:hypothetical protein